MEKERERESMGNQVLALNVTVHKSHTSAHLQKGKEV